MKILIATDSFKDSLSAREVALALKMGFLRGFPGNDIEMLPLADGGEGTVEALVDATHGKRLVIKVMDPLMRETDAFYGITGDGETAIIEMAAASGLEKLDPASRNPWITSTYGTGQLIAAALDRGCRKILIGIGGSATNDCGAGMAEALGIRFLDQMGRPVQKGGGGLGDVDRIDTSGLDPRIGQTEILVACDVSNPLTGPEGASRIYGPQKGADAQMADRLDSNLRYFAGKILETLGTEVETIPGAGAAGGLGAGLIAFLDGKLEKGFDLIAGMLDLEKKISKADLVITGEGKIDRQTLFGKTPIGVARLAARHLKPVVAVTGNMGTGADLLYREGITAIFPVINRPMTLEEAFRDAPEMAEQTGERIARMIRYYS
ncbi:MAG: glycerate kinase [Bacteroidales bacterium]